MRLHLGCGEKYLPGYVNIDYPASEHTVMSVRADIYADIPSLTYPAGTIEEVRSHHVFEHFTRTQALRLLMSWRTWLQPSGRLVIETPDFGACATAYAATFSRRRRLQLGRHMLGSQEAAWANHLDFWDRSKFAFVLGAFGFQNIRFRCYRNSLAQRKSPSVFLDPFYNLAGDLLPESMYRKYGGHKLPNIVVTAEKDGHFKMDEDKVIREILSQYLVGREGEKMLHVWLENYKKGK